MPNHVNRKNKKVSHKKNNKLADWDRVIQDAEKQLLRVNERACGLRQIIADFKKMKEDGMPWPGGEAGTAT